MSKLDKGDRNWVSTVTIFIAAMLIGVSLTTIAWMIAIRLTIAIR